MPQPIRIRVRVHSGVGDVTVLMPHPMETGLRQNESGQTLPAHFITHMAVTLGERAVFSARMSFAVSRDPLVNFRLAGVRPGDRLRVSWTDNLGEVRIDEAVVV